MPLQFSTAAAEAVSHGVKAVVFAPSGFGKTMLSATAPTPLILSAEKGLLSLSPANVARVFGAGTPGITYDVQVGKITTLQDLRDFHLWLLGNGDRGYFKTIVWDSGSEIAEMILSEALKRNRDPRKAYGELQDQMIEVLKNFRDLPGRNVVVIAKEEFVKDGNGIAKRMPMMPGNKLGQALPYLFDEVFFLGIGVTADQKKFRFLQTQPSMDCDAKDRSGALDPIEQPNLTYIFNKITGV